MQYIYIYIIFCRNSDPNTDSLLFVQSPLVSVTHFYSSDTDWLTLALLCRKARHTRACVCLSETLLGFTGSFYYAKSTTQWPGCPSFPFPGSLYTYFKIQFIYFSWHFAICMIERQREKKIYQVFPTVPFELDLESHFLNFLVMTWGSSMPNVYFL